MLQNNLFLVAFALIIAPVTSFQQLVNKILPLNYVHAEVPSDIARCSTKLDVAVGGNYNDKWAPANITPYSSRSEELDLPELSQIELIKLSRGERIQKQSRTGRSGYGMVVVDVPMEQEIVFNTLCDFER